MCDYSLMALPNRLAQEGEELVTHRFPTGSLGLASAAELERAACRRAAPQTFLNRVLSFFDPPHFDPVCAVCIPPGAILNLHDVSAKMQLLFNIGAAETVTFTQLSAAVNAYRDAVRFPNGKAVRLHELNEGMRFTVLDLSGAEELDLEALRHELGEFLPDSVARR